ncbi:hypothetical protein GCM10023324_67880 [Streptomyces youssoufiensis]
MDPDVAWSMTLRIDSPSKFSAPKSERAEATARIPPLETSKSHQGRNDARRHEGAQQAERQNSPTLLALTVGSKIRGKSRWSAVATALAKEEQRD